MLHTLSLEKMCVFYSDSKYSTKPLNSWQEKTITSHPVVILQSYVWRSAKTPRYGQMIQISSKAMKNDQISVKWQMSRGFVKETDVIENCQSQGLFLNQANNCQTSSCMYDDDITSFFPLWIQCFPLFFTLFRFLSFPF